MELDLTATLAVVVATMALFGFANWRARKPAEPLKVRWINYHVVQLACVVVILLMAAHLVTLFSGGSAPAQTGGRPF